MQVDRLSEQLDAYGADPARWPEEQRDAMQGALARDPDARARLREAAELDRALNTYSVAAFDLADRILAAVPGSRLERLLRWLLPAEPDLWWRPAMAAAMPLVLGVAIGISGASVPGTSMDWSAQEQALLDNAMGDGWYD